MNIVDSPVDPIVQHRPDGAVATAPHPPRPHPVPPPPRRSGRWLLWTAIALIALVGTTSAFFASNSKNETVAKDQDHGDESTAPRALPVTVVHPRKGGLARTTEQAGSVNAFEHADLFAKVSGYLKNQTVDIGDRVKRDQLLAEIDDPEILKAVDQMKAMLETAKAKVKIADARIKSAEADIKVCQALVSQASAGVVTQEANVSLRTKQLARIQGLVQREAVEGKLEDEELDKLEAAKSSERFARASVLSAQAQELAKQADLEQTRADLAEARAKVDVAAADLASAEVIAGYTRITSPYDGVVTRRTYHRGDFVRSAADGAANPILSVARTDKMRVVLPMPDVDVPFVDRGDPSVLRIVALPGEEFRGVVSRFAEKEDPESRNMRTEVDLPNPTGRLKEGMYGRVSILLQPAAPDHFTIPSTALLQQDKQGGGDVYIIRDGKARKVSVQVGYDNGKETEIVRGLSAEDEVVTRYNGAIGEGTSVTTETSKAAKSGH